MVKAYCQDSEVSWVDWGQVDLDLLECARRVIELRRKHPVFRRHRWFQGRPPHGSGIADIGWFRPDGSEMSEEDWTTGFVKSLGVFLNGEGIPGRGPRGERIVDESFGLLLNAHHEPLQFILPTRAWGPRWALVLDAARPQAGDGEVHAAGQPIPVGARALVVLRRDG